MTLKACLFMMLEPKHYFSKKEIFHQLLGI